jgi:hypothetical protein
MKGKDWIPDSSLDAKDGKLRAVLDEHLRNKVTASDSSLARNRVQDDGSVGIPRSLGIVASVFNTDLFPKIIIVILC